MKIKASKLEEWSMLLEAALAEDAPGWRVQNVADDLKAASVKGEAEEAAAAQRAWEDSR